jgi:hypothetical protein
MELRVRFVEPTEKDVFYTDPNEDRDAPAEWEDATDYPATTPVPVASAGCFGGGKGGGGGSCCIS